MSGMDPSDIVDDPKTLTKVKLRAALAACEAPLPPVAALKQVYVERYTQYVLPLKKKSSTAKKKTKPQSAEQVSKLSPKSQNAYAKSIGIQRIGFDTEETSDTSEKDIKIKSRKQSSGKKSFTSNANTHVFSTEQSPISNIQELTGNSSECSNEKKAKNQFSQAFMFFAFGLFLLFFFSFIKFYHENLSSDLKTHMQYYHTSFVSSYNVIVKDICNSYVAQKMFVHMPWMKESIN